jgi:hypothetical protein
MNALVTEIASLLDAGGRAIDALVAGVSPELARWQPAPGKWSIHEIVGHLADEERNDFRLRVDYTLHRPGEEWPALDTERTVRESHFNDQPLDALRTDFLLERQKSLAWLAGLHDANWSAAYDHPKRGPFTAASMLCAWAAHDMLHLRQIERILFLHLKRPAPDRTDYAGEW